MPLAKGTPLLLKAQLRLQEEVVARPAEDRGGVRRGKKEASEFPRLFMEENREAERAGSCSKSHSLAVGQREPNMPKTDSPGLEDYLEQVRIPGAEDPSQWESVSAGALGPELRPPASTEKPGVEAHSTTAMLGLRGK